MYHAVCCSFCIDCSCTAKQQRIASRHAREPAGAPSYCIYSLPQSPHKTNIPGIRQGHSQKPHPSHLPSDEVVLCGCVSVDSRAVLLCPKSTCESGMREWGSDPPAPSYEVWPIFLRLFYVAPRVTIGLLLPRAKLRKLPSSATNSIIIFHGLDIMFSILSSQ